MFAALCQHLSLHFTHLVIQTLELAVETDCSLLDTPLSQLRQPLLTFLRVVNLFPLTTDPAAAIDRFQPVFYSGAIPHQTFITMDQLLERAGSVVTVVHGPQHPRLQ